MATEEKTDDKKAVKTAEPAAAKGPRVSTLAGHEGELIQDVSDWLNNGCPRCHQKIVVDTPIYQPFQPGLYPALLFHFGVMHEGVIPPPAPHPDDEKALDTLVAAGLNPDGTPHRIPWRQQIAEAVIVAKRGAR